MYFSLKGRLNRKLCTSTSPWPSWNKSLLPWLTGGVTLTFIHFSLKTFHIFTFWKLCHYHGSLDSEDRLCIHSSFKFLQLWRHEKHDHEKFWFYSKEDFICVNIFPACIYIYDINGINLAFMVNNWLFFMLCGGKKPVVNCIYFYIFHYSEKCFFLFKNLYGENILVMPLSLCC